MHRDAHAAADGQRGHVHRQPARERLHLARELEQPTEAERARVQQRGQLPRRGARGEQRAQLGVHAREERAWLGSGLGLGLGLGLG